MNPQLQQILLKSLELFLRFGVKNLTMDEIARELGMSKKTIYQYVENKSDLVFKATQAYLLHEADEVDKIIKTSKNAVEEILRMIGYISHHLKEFNPAAFHDLQKYYPESFVLFNDYRQKNLLKIIQNNIANGVSEGLYRDNLDADIIAKIYIQAADILIDEQWFPSKKYSFVTIYKEFANYHLRGIVSPKGLKYLEQNNLLKTLQS
jgi:AcrR family transcriptional regulator